MFGILFKQPLSARGKKDCLHRLENRLGAGDVGVNCEQNEKKNSGKEVRKFLLHQTFVCYYFSLFFFFLRYSHATHEKRVVHGLMGWKNNDNPISRQTFTLFFLSFHRVKNSAMERWKNCG